MDTQKTIIFLHGWGASSKIFESFDYYLKNDFSVYFLDLPGFGKSPIGNPMFLKDYAAFVHEFIKNNNIEKPILLGHSFGGAVAAKLAILYPDSISKLILVCASAIRQPRLALMLTKKMADLLKPIAPLSSRNFLLKLLKLDKTDWAKIESPVLKKTFINVIGENLKPSLHLIKAPVLVIWGEKDAVTPLNEGKLITKLIPNAQFSVVKNSGHFLFLEKPNEFIKLIKEFIY